MPENDVRRPSVAPIDDPGYRHGVAIGPMVPLTTAANPFAARILAAHLGAEGIVWELRGNVDGPYPVGPVEVLVAVDDLAVAREVVTEQREHLVTDLDAAPIRAADERTPRELWWLLAMVLMAAATLLLMTITKV